MARSARSLTAMAAATMAGAAMVLATAGMAIGSAAMTAAAPARASAPAAAAQSDVRIGMIEIEGRIAERPNELAMLFGDPDPTFRDLVRTIRETGARNDLDVLVIRLKDARLALGQIQELGEVIAQVREGGRRVEVFSEHYSLGDLLLASHADRALIQSGGAVILPGLYMEEMFLGDTLEWIGITADLLQVGDYKGAAEQLARSSPSPEWDENINQLLDSMYASVRGMLKRGRDLSDEELDEAMRRLWLGLADEAVELGIVDAAIDLPLLGDHYAPGEAQARFETIKPRAERRREVDTTNPFAAIAAMMEVFTKKPEHRPRRETIAILHINGPIMDGDSSPGGLFGGETVGSRTIRNALEEIRRHDLVKGVVVRIDSPGGSATASEVIWQGLRRVAETKPVWVSIGSMAASGGYYVAVGGDRIFVNESSIVGSIGVVGGKLAMGGLYENLKIGVVGRARGPMADMFSTTEPWTEQQRDAVRDRMEHIYNLFTDRVTQGREGIDLSRTAEGRLFTGDKALGLKMADEIGGLDAAIRSLASSLELDEYDVMDYPGPRPLEDVLKNIFGMGAEARASGGAGVLGALAGAPGAEAFAGLRAALGPAAWEQVESSIDALMQLRNEPVVLALPRAIVVRMR